MRFIQTEGGSHLRMRTCVPLFRMSRTAGHVTLKLLCGLRSPMRVTYALAVVPISARENVLTLFRISGTGGSNVLKFGEWLWAK